MIRIQNTGQTGWKCLLPALGIWLLPLMAAAQKAPAAQPLLFPLDTFWQVATADINLIDDVDNLQIQLMKSSGRLKRMSTDTSWNPAGYFLEEPLELRAGDLMVRYRLPKTGPEEFYEVAVAFKLNGEPLTPQPPYLKGDVGSGIRALENAALKTITWTNLLENYLNLEGELEMTLTIISYGLIPGCLEVNCAAPMPRVNHKPFIWAGIAGAALIGAGQIFDSRADDTYEEYANFKPLENPGEDPEDLYREANGQHHTYLTLTYAGITVLAVDAAWLLIRELQYKRKRQLYRACCRQSALQLRPAVDLPAGEGMAQLGVRLKLNF